MKRTGALNTNSDNSELRDLKKLLMVLLFKLGASSDEIGAGLGITGRRVQQLIPVKKIEKLNFGKSRHQ